MIHADRCDHHRQRRVDHVGRIEPPAEADFQQQHIGRMLREQIKRRRGFHLENRDRRAGIGLFAAFERRAQFIVTNQSTAAGPAEAIAFVDPHQIGRCNDVDTQAGGFQDRAQIRDGRALAVGTGDMDDRRQPALGMVERRENAPHPLERKVNELGVQGREPGEDRI